MDTYSRFSDLAARESEFDVTVIDRTSDVTILAPHGGRIEPNTTEIATLIAGDEYNLFCFNGRKNSGNHTLHLTSHRFDHPRALKLVQSSSYVVCIHGCSIAERLIYIGGLDRELVEQTCSQLSRIDINTISGDRRYGGVNPDNLCNRGYRKKGMQLELSRPLRDCPKDYATIASAVRTALAEIKNGRG